MKKFGQVVMLPTKDLVTNVSYDIMMQTLHFNTQDVYKNNQHLYIIDTSDIKEGDYFIRDTEIQKCFKVHDDDVEFETLKESVYCGKNTFWSKKYCKKVILSTDSTLNVPLITESFIREFINFRGEIKDVIIEFNDFPRKVKIRVLDCGTAIWYHYLIGEKIKAIDYGDGFHNYITTEPYLINGVNETRIFKRDCSLFINEFDYLEVVSIKQRQYTYKEIKKISFDSYFANLEDCINDSSKALFEEWFKSQKF